MKPKHPVGTKIKFIKFISDRHEVYARPGDSGLILEGESREGYRVNSASHPEWFGAAEGEFEVVSL
jgi:hypothetical protein